MSNDKIVLEALQRLLENQVQIMAALCAPQYAHNTQLLRAAFATSGLVGKLSATLDGMKWPLSKN